MVNTDGRLSRIGQLHHVVEILRSAAHLENVHQSFVRTGDRLELLDAFELALEGACIFERGAMNNLYRPECPQFVSGQPNFAVTSATNRSEQFVVGNSHKGSCSQGG